MTSLLPSLSLSGMAAFVAIATSVAAPAAEPSFSRNHIHCGDGQSHVWKEKAAGRPTRLIMALICDVSDPSPEEARRKIAADIARETDAQLANGDHPSIAGQSVTESH
jgi:hypothetical protein